MTSDDTIFALSSGRPPAAIAVIRISGSAAARALATFVGALPEPRRAVRRRLRDGGAILDEALILWLPGPDNATGEDVAELHLHGGRAVVAAVEQALSRLEGLRPAEPGEFTRRALLNGRIDLIAAEGLADLLMAETESQRRAALGLTGGALSRDVARWREALLRVSAAVEAELDFADEAAEGPRTDAPGGIAALLAELDSRIAAPTIERLRDGVRVALLGPPNSGKSTLLNALVERDAAIVSSQPGTTRDVIEAPVAIDGVPFVLVDTAGLREATDEIEQVGVALAHENATAADLILWLGDAAPPLAWADRTILLHARADGVGRASVPSGRIAVSGLTGGGLPDLRAAMTVRATVLLPSDSSAVMNRRHRELAGEVAAALRRALTLDDPLLIAEELRAARRAVDRIIGKAGVEDMLDHLFGSLCIGK